MDLIDRFPQDASGGCDFLTGLGVREYVTVDHENREVRRPEKVLVLARTFIVGDPPPPPGRVCISETTARNIGTAIGMYPPSAYYHERSQARALARENDHLSARVAELERRLEQMLEDTGTAGLRVVYVAADGSEHGSKAALLRHNQTAPQEVPA